MVERFSVSRRGMVAMGAGGLLLAARPSLAPAEGEAADPIDAIVGRFMRAFEVPGFAVAVVRPGRPAFTRGYGVRRLGRPERVDSDTLFAIASNSKAFVAASIAILVEAGKLAWDAPVVTYMPDFAMYDPAVTRMMTVRDLLCHRSGLALGAGDLMQFPLSNHTRQDMLRGLRYLKPARGFRAGYDYDNILYVVAGLLIERVSGLSWEDFVTQRLLRPLGMRHAVADRLLVRTDNVVARHARLGPPVRGMGPLRIVEPDESPAASPAGGIHAGVAEIVPWLETQLGRGQAPGGPRLWSEANAAEMWKPQVITAATIGATEADPVRPVMQGYGLGWFVQDFRGRRLVWHSGGLSGQITQTALLPEQGIGLAVYSNTEDRVPVAYLRYALLDHLLGVTATDWIAAAHRATETREAEARREAAGGDIRTPAGGPSLALGHYAGRYRDPWYGDVTVSERGGRLWIDFTRTPVFKGPLEPWGPDTFRTRWAEGAGEDAVVRFVVENGAVPRLEMKALSPLADFSYDFQHLDLRRVE